MRIARSEVASGAAVCFGQTPRQWSQDRKFLGTRLNLDHRRHTPKRTNTTRSQGPVHCLLDVTEANFQQEVLESEVPVLVDFWADWCGPCRLLEPIMKRIEQEYGGRLRVVKVNTDDNPELVEKYNVYGLPTIILVRDGEVVLDSPREGVITRPALKEYLQGLGIPLEEAPSN